MQKQRRGFDLVDVSGIKISLDYSWMVIFALVLASLSTGYFPLHYPGQSVASYWLFGAITAVLFFASVLVHELSHALVANHLGHDVKQITLFLFGGMAHLSGEPKTPADELKIAAVGPLTSLVLGGVFWMIAFVVEASASLPLVTAMFSYLAFINVALAIFNLLPGYPLDGGRLLRAYLWQRSGSLQSATARAADWGGGIALGIMVLGGLQIFSGALVGGVWLILIGMFLRGAARAGYYGLVLDHSLGHTRVRDLMVADPVIIPPEVSVAEAIDGYFLRHGFGGYPVADAERVYGLLTLAAVRSCPAEERPRRSAREVARPLDDEIAISPAATAAEALRRMANAEIGRLLVMENGRLVGLISRSAIVRFAQVSAALTTESGAVADEELESAA